MPDLNTAYELAGIATAIALAVGWWLDRRRNRKRETAATAVAEAIAAAEKATIAAKLAARLDAQDAVLKGLADGFKAQFGTNGFVLHQMVKEQGEALGLVRDGLAAHVAQHVDRSFGR